MRYLCTRADCLYTFACIDSPPQKEMNRWVKLPDTQIHDGCNRYLKKQKIYLDKVN